jgi:hypothetical protein
MKIIGGLLWSAVFSPQSFEIGWGSLCLTKTERIMQIVTFQTTLHSEGIWAYLVRYNGITVGLGYAPTKEEAERSAELCWKLTNIQSF